MRREVSGPLLPQPLQVEEFPVQVPKRGVGGASRQMLERKIEITNSGLRPLRWIK